MNTFAGATFVTSAAEQHQCPADDVPEVAFAGRSNAGKSSALNTLCGHSGLARVSRTPGRTQLLNFFEVQIPAALAPGARKGRLVDLPGYGFAQVARDQRRDWGPVVGGFLQHRPNLRGIVIVMDIRHALADQDRQMLDWARHCGRPCHLLLTKADKLGRNAARQELMKVQRELPALHDGASVQLFSVPARTGVDEAVAHIAGWLAAPVG